MALMLSRLAAFRLERNLRYSAMQKTVHMPLGFLTKNSSGKMRKVIDYNAGIIHTFVTHQLPDLAGGITVFVARLILIFVFFWRLGFACLIPLVIALYNDWEELCRYNTAAYDLSRNDKCRSGRVRAWHSRGKGIRLSGFMTTSWATTSG